MVQIQNQVSSKHIGSHFLKRLSEAKVTIRFGYNYLISFTLQGDEGTLVFGSGTTERTSDYTQNEE